MQLTSDHGTPELTDERSARADSLLTYAERKERYRQKLKNHQEGKGKRLKDFLLEKRRYFRNLDVVPRRKRAEDTDLMCRYYNAEQYGSYNELGMYEDHRQEGDFAYAIPILAGHVDQAWVELFKVRPQYAASTKDRENATARSVAKMCEELGVEERDRVIEPKTHSDIFNMLLCGESYGILGWEPPKVNPKKIKRPKYKSVEVDLPAGRECADCKEILPAEATTCPRCQSTNIAEIPGGKAQQQTIDSYTEVMLGENVLHLPHMLATQRDMSAIEPEDSTFFVEYSYLDKHVAEWTYQSEVEPSREGLPIEMQLRFDLERSSNQTDAIIGSARLAPPGREAGFGQGANNTSATVSRKQPQERHFWEPSEYGQFLCEQDEMLPDGRVIKAGTQLGDFFPDGIYVLFVGDTIMEVKECVRGRKVTLVRYGRIAGTNAGAGLKKAMPLQDALNDNFNLTQTVKHTVGHPLTVINGQFVNELPAAGNVLKITKAGVQSVDSVVKQYPGQSMNNNDGTQEMIEGAMQFIMGTSTIGTGVAGAPDMRSAGTATGVTAMQEQASRRQAGPVDQRIQRDKDLIIQCLENIQEYSTPEQIETLGKRFGKDVVKAFMATNLRQDIVISIKANSEMPRSMALQTANFMALAQAMQQLMQFSDNPSVMEFLSEMATSMGFPFSIGQGRNDHREAEYRLTLLNEIEELLMQSQPELLTDSVSFAATMYQKLAELCGPLVLGGEEANPAAPDDTGIPRIFMQWHPAFMDAYKDAIFGEQAKGWSQAHKLCVIQMWLDHYKAQMSQQAVMAQLQAGLSQAMNPQPAPEDEAALKDADHQRQQEAAEMEHQRQLELRDKDADLGERSAAADHGRRLTEQGAQHQGAMDLERSRQSARA